MPSLADAHPLPMLAFQKNGWLNPEKCRSPVQLLPSPHYNERPAGTAITAAVLHNISLPPDTWGDSYVNALFLGTLASRRNEHPYFADIAGLRVSAHFFISRGGAITQFVSIYDRAWHAGKSYFQERENCNDFTIGIEFNGADRTPYTLRQYQAGAQLLAAIQRSCPALTAITTHSAIAPERKTDPGPAFNLNCLNRLLIAADNDGRTPPAIVC